MRFQREFDKYKNLGGRVGLKNWLAYPYQNYPQVTPPPPPPRAWATHIFLFGPITYRDD